MATLYVNSITGANANNGSTWSLAKQTLAGASSAATAGDTIYCHGIFSEALPVTKNLNWVAGGYAILDGTMSINGASFGAFSANLIGLIFKNFLTAALQFSPVTGADYYNLFFQNCVFDGNVRAIYDISNLGGSILCIQAFRNTVFLNQTTAAIDINKSSTQPLNIELENSAFSGNAIGIRRPNSNSGVVRARHCAFRDVVMVSLNAAAGWDSVSDYNAFDFAAGKCVVGGVDKTTLTDWRTAVGSPRDTNSIDRIWSADVGDYANRVLRSNPAGYLLTAGAGSTPIGLTLPGVTISNNRNASLWTGGVFSNTELDGSGYLVLSAGQTVGTWKSDVIDFGAAINAKSVEIALAGEAAALPYLDYDTADSPGYFNVRVRGSNTLFAKADASPSWVIVPRRAEIGAYMSNALRYWQIELTLRA